MILKRGKMTDCNETEELVQLPVGLSEFNAFCETIFTKYSLPDMPSYRNAVATMIMHLPQTEDKAALSFFAKSIRKAMANQVAYEVIQQIREDEKAKEKAQSDANAIGTVSTDEPVSKQEV